MRLLARLLVSFLVNALALFVAARFIPGFTLTLTLESVAVAAGLLTVINIFIRPILKLFLTPVIILTFGIAIILLNALILWALDFFLESLMIEGIVPLLYATVLIGLVNLVIGGVAKTIVKNA